MMAQLFSHPLIAWLMTWWLHSTLLLGAVWLLWTLVPGAAPRLREYVWKIALVGSVISATAVTVGVPGAAMTRVELPAAMVTSPASRAAPNRPEPPPPASLVVPSASTTEIGAPVTSTSVHVRGRDNTASVALLLWLGIAGWLLLRQWRSLRMAIGQLGVRRPLGVNHRANQMLVQLVERAGAKSAPTLSQSSAGSGPVSLPSNEICLPAWALRELDDAQLEGVLAHELAHCMRFDPQLLLALDALTRVFFMQPLLRVARAQLATLAELAADEVAGDITGDRHAVADSLAECAGRIVSQKTVLGAAMAHRSSAFYDRMRRLLRPEQFARGAPSWRTRAIAVASTFGLAMLLPGFSLATDGEPQLRPSHSTQVLTDDDGTLTKIEMSIQRDDYRLSIKGHGNFWLNDDETDVTQMDDNARLTIEHDANGQRRKMRFVGDDGAIQRTYWHDGNMTDIDAPARRWLAQLLPILMRESGINAKQRAARLHRRGGADGLLDDIALIHADYPARLYIGWLVEHDDLSDTQYERVLDAARNIDSDFESRSTLMSIVEHEQMDDQRATGLLDVSANIQSDFELRTLTEHLIAASEIETIETDRLIEVISTIKSDFEMHQAFAAMLGNGDISPSGLQNVLAVAAREIDSDFELRSLLTSVAQQVSHNPALAAAYIAATQNIDSDFERREALCAFALHARSGWSDALRSAAGISSDFERAEALIALAAKMPRSDENAAIFREALEDMGSFERSRAEAGL